jgi:hypothetical protein
MNIDIVATIADVGDLASKVFSKKAKKLTDSLDTIDNGAKALTTNPMTPPTLKRLANAIKKAFADNPAVSLSALTLDPSKSVLADNPAAGLTAWTLELRRLPGKKADGLSGWVELTNLSSPAHYRVGRANWQLPLLHTRT